jgi:hypothetical protein
MRERYPLKHRQARWQPKFEQSKEFGASVIDVTHIPSRQVVVI